MQLLTIVLGNLQFEAFPLPDVVFQELFSQIGGRALHLLQTGPSLGSLIDNGGGGGR